jgi:NAD+ diphosphatase
MIRSNFGERKWGLPGGGVKRKETLQQAAVREVYEEVGVELSPEKLKYLDSQKSGYGRWGWPYVHLEFYEYPLNEKPRQLKLQRFEVSEACWISHDALQASPDIDEILVGIILQN